MVSRVEKIVQSMRASPASVAFADLERVCDHFFGPARRASGSHRVYRTPWQGDPRVNIQNRAGTAKPYQVRQVLAAIDRLSLDEGEQT